MSSDTLKAIPTAELLFDRQEAFNDALACHIAIQRGEKQYEARLSANLRQIEVIRVECARRGFDPAQYDQVKEALVE